ncbi:hypothetical protein [Pseudidiomarina sp.]|uniref:hypothetical protein n=1 Tax=Pseudidiomarina sp. TaxID=2081707 RepID=UPI003A970FF3
MLTSDRLAHRALRQLEVPMIGATQRAMFCGLHQSSTQDQSHPDTRHEHQVEPLESQK